MAGNNVHALTKEEVASASVVVGDYDRFRQARGDVVQGFSSFDR